MTFFSKYLFQVTPSPTLATGATFCKALLCSSAKRGGGNISLTIFISIYIFNFLKFYLQYILSASTAALKCKKGGLTILPHFLEDIEYFYIIKLSFLKFVFLLIWFTIRPLLSGGATVFLCVWRRSEMEENFWFLTFQLLKRLLCWTENY